uniref:Transposase n=175 Tax=Pseudomonadota TaxID=1224 RepID=A0A2S1PQI9_KLEPN|nr:transposase [Klebsiella pneumoniae]
MEYIKLSYHHLNFEDRTALMLESRKEGFSARKFAELIKRHPSTIYRELKRNSINDVYQARYASDNTFARRRRGHRKLKIDSILWKFIVEAIRCLWSPQQIAKRLKTFPDLDQTMNVSHTTIYSTIRALPKGELKKDLLSCLRHENKKRKANGDHASEASARVDDLPVSISAVLMAEACNIGLEPLIRSNVPALTRHRLNWTKANYLRAETITSANARLVDFQATLPLAQIWGGGEVASADGMRFVTPVRTINAGPNRKYFGNNRGITWYNFVSDQYSGFHGIVIPGTLRDSIFVLEGLLEQETGLNPTEIMTDTAGASELVFGLFWLLGYQFSPRLADAGASVFWRMDHDADYGVLNDIARGQSDPRKIVLQWDEMIRTAGSLKLGKVQASVLVRSLLKSERPSGLTQAIIEVGRINKTLYLLNYIDDEDYRRRILTQLNRGESRHAVARAICHGQKGEIRKRYTDGQEDQLGHWGWSLTPSCYGTLFICRQPWIISGRRVKH